MADEENILGGKLSIEDNYSSALMKFANKVLGAENKFKQFADKVIGSNNKIGANLTKTQSEVDKFAQKFIQQGNRVSDAINKANEKVKENQEKTIEGLTKKYLKLGMTIQDAYSKAQQESNHIWNGDSKPTGSNNQIKDFAQSFLSGGIGGVVGKLGLIGTGVTATVSVLKKIDSAMDTGFGILNKLSDNMFSPEGIKEALGTTMEYQSTRAKLDLFYGSENEGRQAYQLASKVALDTFADPGSLGEAMSIMKKNGISPKESDLYSYLDMVGSRGDGTTAKEAALAIEDAMNGEWERLKEYSITTTKLKKYVEQLKKTDKTRYKEFKNVFDKRGSVTDSQKAYQLILDYVRNSEINGYAQKYANTAQGSIDNLEGMWEQIKTSIMGLDDAGDVVKGSALFEFTEMVNNLKETLGSDSATKGFGEISKGLGEGFKAFGEAFDEVMMDTDWEEVGKAVADSIKVISDAIVNLSKSGALEDLAENLPILVNTLVNNQILKANGKVQLGVDLANGNYAGAINNYGNNLADRAMNTLGMRNDDGSLRKNEADWLMPLKTNPITASTTWLFEYMSKRNKNSNNSNMITDSQIENMIKNSNINDSQKANLREYINGDDLGSYSIHIDRMEINSDNIDDWINQLKQAQANRR